MSKRTRSEQIEALVEKFALAVIEQVEQIDHGTASRGNRAAKRYMAAVDKLFGVYGDEGRDALKGLLSHENGEVRSAAASYLLRFCTNDAMAVLKDTVKNGRGFSPICAFYCLKNWEEGTWALDPAPEPADEGGGDRKEGPSLDC